MSDRAKVIKIITVSSVLFIVMLFGALIINLIQLSSLSARERKLNAELVATGKAIESGNREIMNVQSAEYIDRYAREYLNMHDEREEVYKKAS